MTTRLLTSESVTIGHPDKLADQISDAILDAHLAQDPYARVACETALSDGLAVVFGEITSEAEVDHEAIARRVIRRVGYTAETGFDSNNARVIINVRRQSPDIARAVNGIVELGAGDQGIVYGYATDETVNLMPAPLSIAHRLTASLAERWPSSAAGLRPDGKSQVTGIYENDDLMAIDTIVISAQHNEDKDLEQLRAELKELAEHEVKAFGLPQPRSIIINPGGRFVLGGPAADSGLTGRKIIVDTYGGAIPHGGGAFSGKDATKVDRSGAYAARHAAVNVVAAGLARRCEISIAYAIGRAQPIAVNANTFGTGRVSDAELVAIIDRAFDFRPGAIIERLGLRRPIYESTARNGHFGKDHFPWEQADAVADLEEVA